MTAHQTLENYLRTPANRVAPDVALTVRSIASACTRIARIVALGPLAGALGAARGGNADGDVQKELDIIANETVIDALQNAPVASLISEELDEPIRLWTGAPLDVAIDPLDGSSNIDTNVSIGTIFSILPAADGKDGAIPLQPGRNQVAAGYCIYGPQTALALTLGRGTHVFTLDPEIDAFRLTATHIQIPETTREFAINVSNFRHWNRPVRAYVDDCLAGEDGVGKRNYNMRWIASLVAECHRIISRGGIFLYPEDARSGYANGRLRLVYECNPIAFLIEQAGGAATNGLQRILDISPESVHQRVPMMFGSKREIRRLEKYYTGRDLHGRGSQLFNKRGLFRA